MDGCVDTELMHMKWIDRWMAKECTWAECICEWMNKNEWVDFACIKVKRSTLGVMVHQWTALEVLTTFLNNDTKRNLDRNVAEVVE